MEIIQDKLSSSHSLPGSRTQPQDSEKMSWNQGFDKKLLKNKTKASFYSFMLFAIRLSTNNTVKKRLHYHVYTYKYSFPV